MIDTKESLELLVREHVETTADFPKPGINFVDLLPLFAKEAWIAKRLISFFESKYKDKIDCVAGIDARGFIIGAALSTRLELPFLAIRKAGKYPPPVHKEVYSSEYDNSALELKVGASSKFKSVLVIDDVLATGGTAASAVNLLERDGAKVHALAFIIELSKLNGRARLPEGDVFSVADFLE
jgi:adenine phosphoribosyltransferase